MNKFLIALLGTCTVFLFGCSSSKMLTTITSPISVEFDKVSANVAVEDFYNGSYRTHTQTLKCIIKNSSANRIELVIDQCSITDTSGFSHRCVTGEVRVLLANVAQPNLLIPANGQIQIILTPQDLWKQSHNVFGEQLPHYYCDFMRSPSIVKLYLVFKDSSGTTWGNTYEIACSKQEPQREIDNKGYGE